MTITSKGYAGTIMAGADLATWATLQGRSYLARAFSDWRVSAVSGGSGRIVQVAPGVIAGVGVEDGLDVATNASTLATLATDGTRYDMIVARRTWQTTNATSIAVIQGTSTRALPSRNTTPGTIDDQPLALVKLVRSGGTYSITETVDLRLISWEPGVYIIFDDLALGLADRPGIRLWNVNTGVTWERLYNTSGSRVWVQRSLDRLDHMANSDDGSASYQRLYTGTAYGKSTQLTLRSNVNGSLPATGDVLYVQTSDGTNVGPTIFGVDRSGNLTHVNVPASLIGTVSASNSVADGVTGSGWGPNDTASTNYAYAIGGGMATLRMNLRRNGGGAVTFSASGNPSVSGAIAKLKPAWIPRLQWYGVGRYIGSTNADYGVTVRVSNVDGSVYIVSGQPNSTIPVNGTNGYVSLEFVLPSYPLLNP